MNELAQNDDFKDKVVFLMVNLEDSIEEVTAYKEEKGLCDAIIQAAGYPPNEYWGSGIHWYPHKTVIDKAGNVFKNGRAKEVDLPNDIMAVLETDHDRGLEFEDHDRGLELETDEDEADDEVKKEKCSISGWICA
eukprot:gnl/MRDRNA2_/MRDRNA2_100239_c0_seq1.p2 gnl/MRDRNA2_/MRDRNA2_100239_c0~~gnl/MRDRNA2_/MRDRNA2_100239_c0_seq1.p2  ORF type:complete len:135 (-),score=44.23 gnl/MRDRNA2_/MRDRNA2_100239_c0_seq1:568-972(-)